MIALIVTYKCKPGMREEFLEAIIAEGIDVACRADEGNLKYDYYMSTDNDDEMLLVEKWRDAASIKLHNEQPHFKRIMEIKDEFLEETTVEKFVSE